MNENDVVSASVDDSCDAASHTLQPDEIGAPGELIDAAKRRGKQLAWSKREDQMIMEERADVGKIVIGGFECIPVNDMPLCETTRRLQQRALGTA